jgi:hypothetical protein
VTFKRFACPSLWRFLVERFGVRSVLDVGCGEGHAVLFFHRLGLFAHGIDGLLRNANHSATIRAKPARSQAERKRQAAAISMHLLWAHDLIRMVPHTHRYHLPKAGRIEVPHMSVKYAAIANSLFGKIPAESVFVRAEGAKGMYFVTAHDSIIAVREGIH